MIAASRLVALFIEIRNIHFIYQKITKHRVLFHKKKNVYVNALNNAYAHALECLTHSVHIVTTIRVCIKHVFKKYTYFRVYKHQSYNHKSIKLYNLIK